MHSNQPIRNEEELFSNALDIEDEAELQSYLEHECGCDVSMRARLDTLIAAHHESVHDDFLEPRAIPVHQPERKLPFQFGDYEVTQKIARGAMGVVYRARQTSLNREVALKFLRGSVFATGDEVSRFRAEAEVCARLNHPNILPIYEVGEIDDQHYFSMKLIEGGNLETMRDELRADLKRGVAVLAKASRALAAAHKHGVVHRDLKPENILIDEDGEPHVVDFGLAKQQGASGGALTFSADVVIGTPSFMAPEQAEDGSQVTVLADIYSLGAVLYHLLTGRPPFAGDSVMSTLQLLKSAKPVPPREIDPNIDPNLEAIALRCLSKQPSKRFPSATVLAEELERWPDRASVRSVRRANLLWRALIPLSVIGLMVAAAVSISTWKDENQSVKSDPSLESVDMNAQMVGGVGEDRIVGVPASGLSHRIGSDHMAWRDSGVQFAAGGDDQISREWFSDFTRFQGTDSDDHLQGDDRDNVLTGFRGMDSLYGGRGLDLLDGGEDADQIDGGPDIDFATYESSNAGVIVDLENGIARGGEAQGDSLKNIEGLIGSAFTDELTGDMGDNDLQGMSGDDVIVGGRGTDRIIGGSGADRMDGGQGDDILSYLSSNERVIVDLAAQTCHGGHAAGDTFSNFAHVEGSEFDDAIYGDENSNVLNGSGGSDILFGRGGIDYFVGSAGLDHFDGGSEMDFANYERSSFGVLIDFKTGSCKGGDAEGDTLTSIEGVIGSQFADDLFGDQEDNNLQGMGGHDRIFGGEGNDTVIGGSGGDRLDGGPGDDVLSYLPSAAAVKIDLSTKTVSGGHAEGDRIESFEHVHGSSFDDVITGDALHNLLMGFQGDDTLTGASGNDHLHGGEGRDIVVLSGRRSDYRIRKLEGNRFEFTDTRTGSLDGVDTLTDIEIVRFADETTEIRQLLEKEES